MFSASDKTDMLLIYGECRKNADLAVRLYSDRYLHRQTPSHTTFRRLEQNLREYESFSKPKIRRRHVATPEIEAAVIEMVTNNPHTSQREIARTVDISKYSVFNILKANTFHPYHVMLVQHLTEEDYPRRVRFCQFLRNKLADNPNFLRAVLFSDEATFNNNGVVNRHNSHYYSQENPNWIRETNFQRIFSCNAWCGIVDDFIIGPHFFEGHLNGEMYLSFLRNDLPPLLEELPLDLRQRMWFQNDGAPAHYYRRVRCHLNRTFNNKVIARAAVHPWPPRSPDLTPLDFFLWGKVKNDVYQTPVDTEEELRERVIQSCNSITPQMLAHVRNNMLKRIDLCEQQGGQQFEHLLRH